MPVLTQQMEACYGNMVAVMMASEHDERAAMPRVRACDKCHRDDVEGALTTALNHGHWRACVDDSTGVIVDGTLLQCPTENHWVCARCIRGNWWGVRAKPGTLCPCNTLWPLHVLVLVGVSRPHVLAAARGVTFAPLNAGVCDVSGLPCLDADEDDDRDLRCRWCAFFGNKCDVPRPRAVTNVQLPPSRRCATLMHMCRARLSTEEMSQIRMLCI